MSRIPIGLVVYTALTAALLLSSLALIFFNTPADATLGIVQKIFYFHVSAAIAMMLCLSAGSMLSLLDLVSPAERIDALARAGIETGVLFALMVLTSGPLWARKSWGQWWDWEPRLTLTLLLLLLAVAVLGIRAMAPEGKGRRIGAALATLAAPLAWFIHVAVEKWGGTHPMVLKGGGIQSPQMQMTFRISLLAILSLAGLLWTLRFRGLRLEQQLARVQLELSAQTLRQQSRS